MKIAFLHHIFQAGSGIEQVILELSTVLRRQGHDAIIVTYDNRHTRETVPVVEFRVPSTALGGIISPMCLRTNEQIRETLSWADVVVTSLYPMSVIPLWPHRVDAKIVFIDWGVQPYSTFSSLVDKAYLWLLNRMDGYVVKRSDLVLVANNVTRAWVEKRGVHPVKSTLYGLNFDRLNVGARYDHLRERHPELSGAGGILLYVGRQSPHKNIELLIRTVELLKLKGRNTKLLLVGPASFPKYAATLRSLVRQLGLERDVIFTGLVSELDLAGYYNLCDIFVNASRWEGFLNPEPYAFKKPIVAYGIHPHGETVRHGITGLLVDKLTPDNFARRVSYLLDNDVRRCQMGETGYQWAKKNLDYDVVARNFAKILGRILWQTG